MSECQNIGNYGVGSIITLNQIVYSKSFVVLLLGTVSLCHPNAGPLTITSKSFDPWPLWPTGH